MLRANIKLGPLILAGVSGWQHPQNLHWERYTEAEGQGRGVEIGGEVEKRGETGEREMDKEKFDD